MLIYSSRLCSLSYHALERTQERRISLLQIHDVLTHPDVVYPGDTIYHKIFAQWHGLTVVVGTWWSHPVIVSVWGSPKTRGTVVRRN